MIQSGTGREAVREPARQRRRPSVCVDTLFIKAHERQKDYVRFRFCTKPLEGDAFFQEILFDGGTLHDKVSLLADG